MGRPRGPCSLLIGVLLDSSVVSTTSPPPMFLAVIWPRFAVRFVWLPTPLPLLRLFPALITSLISCTPSVPLYTGTLVKVWKRESSLRLVKIWLPSRRTMKRLRVTLWKRRNLPRRSIRQTYMHFHHNFHSRK